jgi:biopolymer transport protein ExbD
MTCLPRLFCSRIYGRIELWQDRSCNNQTVFHPALTDIILNIFIFFFTAFSLVYTFNPMRESRIIVKLPQADIKSPVDQTEPIVVTINNRNEVFLKNQPKNLRDLKTELESLIAFNKTRPVIVRADKTVVFDRVVQVLDVAKNAVRVHMGANTISRKRAICQPSSGAGKFKYQNPKSQTMLDFQTSKQGKGALAQKLFRTFEF